jgi:hypothetical protein
LPLPRRRRAHCVPAGCDSVGCIAAAGLRGRRAIAVAPATALRHCPHFATRSNDPIAAAELVTPYTTVQMTCTGRPSTQEWQLSANCTYGNQGADIDVTGSLATGDSVSSLHCPITTYEVLASFQVIS